MTKILTSGFVHTQKHSRYRLILIIILGYLFILLYKNTYSHSLSVTKCRFMKNELRNAIKSRQENPQKLTQISPRSQQRHLVGKGTTQKDAIKDITSDSQVNSYFPYRWSPASLTFNIYVNLFLYLYITRIMIKKRHIISKITKQPNQKSCLGTASNKITWGGGGGGGA